MRNSVHSQSTGEPGEGYTNVIPIGTPPKKIKVYSTGGGGGGNMEARIAKLESDVSHIQKDISEINRDVRDIKHDAKVDFRILFGSIITSTLGLAWLIAKSAGWI